MSQIAYSINIANAFAGQLGDIGPKTVRSYAAAEQIPFGMGVMRDTGDNAMIRLPFVNHVVLTESTALVASNSTVGTVNVTTLVAGVPTTVSTVLTATVFATDDPTTLAAIAAKIAAVAGVASATVGVNNITVVADADTSVTLSGFATTGGASQPTWSYADSSSDFFAGVSLFDQGLENPLVTTSTSIANQQNAQSVQYPVGWPVSTLTRGPVYVQPEVAVKVGDPVYVRFAAGANGIQPGAFGNTDDSGTCVQVTRARWLDPIAGATTNGIPSGAVGLLEISLP